MASRGLNATSTYRFMLDAVAETAAKRGRRPVAWNDAYELFGDGLDQDLVLMFWTEIDEMVGAAVAGHHVVNAWDMELYLDYGTNQVENIYNFDPCAYAYGVNASYDADAVRRARVAARVSFFFGATRRAQVCANVLGESVAFWASDYDASNVVASVFPRAAALAERLWSPRDLVAAPAFFFFYRRNARVRAGRLHELHARRGAAHDGQRDHEPPPRRPPALFFSSTWPHSSRAGKFRCELLGRGVAAAPVDVPWHKADGAAAPPSAGSCLYQ